MMGGTLAVESTLGQGSCFHFTVCCQAIDALPVAPTTTASNTDSLRDMQVLLVEDNRLNQQVASSFLKKVGVNVTLANDGSEGLNILLAQPVDFDAVLMDLQMPVMDGLTATMRIRAMSQFDDLPIIAMTAHAMAEDRQKCLDAGMQDYLTKPIDVRQLYAALTRARLPKF
jgi:two-component system sensor histidine kinase/response regulator